MQGGSASDYFTAQQATRLAPRGDRYHRHDCNRSRRCCVRRLCICRLGTGHHRCGVYLVWCGSSLPHKPHTLTTLLHAGGFVPSQSWLGTLSFFSKKIDNTSRQNAPTNLKGVRTWKASLSSLPFSLSLAPSASGASCAGSYLPASPCSSLAPSPKL